ncbi:MAG TPA: YfhO family protein [Vicinamibacterales bacterium]|nr:YfhO family protein [Vicinamibacterales bacterium]
MKRPLVIVLSGTALLLVIVLRGILDPSVDRLPGIDSGNIYAWEVYTRSVLAEWKLPYWNPYHFAGTPHLADPQTTVLYPPAMLLRWLPVPAFLGWMLALHLWIAGAGTLFAARAIGAGWIAASAAAVAVMLGGSVSGWIHGGHLLLIYSAAWVPWALGLAIVSVRSGRVVPDGRLVAVLALQFLTGYLQGSLYLAAAVASYFIFSALWPPLARRASQGAPHVSDDLQGAAQESDDAHGTRVRRWAPLAQLALLGVLCAGAAAFQLLPTAVLVAEAGRSGGLPYREALDGSWQAKDLATLLFPFYGLAEDPPYRMLPDRLAYVGWILIAFAPFAFFTRARLRLAVFLGTLVALVLIVALGDAGGLFRLHYALFPGLRVPGRILFLATSGLALLGALGLESFVSLAARREWIRMAVPAVISGAAASVAAYAAFGASQPAIPPVHGWPWIPILLSGGLVAIVASGMSGWRRLALATALAAVVLDLTTLSLGAVGTIPVETEAEIRQWIGPPVGGRAISLCENRISAREFLQNREPTLDGLPGLHLRDYADWAFMAKSGDVPPGGGLYHRIGGEGDQPARRDLLDMANVSRIVACTHGADGRLSGMDIQRNERSWPRAVWVCDAEEVSRREAIARIIRGRYDASGGLQPRHYIKLRWAAGVHDARRAELERVHHLQDGVVVEGVTWKYLLGDASLDAVLAIMRDPEVEDTHGVDRATGAFMPTDELQDSIPEITGDVTRTLMPSTAACAGRGDVNVRVMDRPDGRVVAQVDAPADGYVFFSEPYYRERRAWVDGRGVPMLKANLTFTAVAVPAGRHDVELRYVPSSFYVGSLISGATAAGYAFVFVRRPRRKAR